MRGNRQGSSVFQDLYDYTSGFDWHPVFVVQLDRYSLAFCRSALHDHADCNFTIYQNCYLCHFDLLIRPPGIGGMALL